MMGDEYYDEEVSPDDDFYDEYGYETQGFEGDGLSMYQDGIMEDDIDENARQHF